MNGEIILKNLTFSKIDLDKVSDVENIVKKL